MKKSIIIIFIFAFTPNFLIGSVFAAAPASPATKGQQKLQDTINAEEARVAELKVQLDPSQGINHTLHKSSRGNDVKLLQKFLKVYGAYPEGLITGYFGSLTQAAVKKFQEKEAIDVVGIAGPKTRGRIIELSRKKSQKQASKGATTSVEITDTVLSTAIAPNGTALASLIHFASTTENIYAVLSLKNAKQDSQISYVRYYNGSYVDSEVSHPSRNGLSYFHFQWSLKPGKTRTAGDYSLQFYVDGKKSKIIHYAIY